MIDEMKIKERLADAIRQSGISQSKLAKNIGVAQQQISCYLHEQKLPTLITFAKLCEVLDTDPSYILDLELHAE